MKRTEKLSKIGVEVAGKLLLTLQNPISFLLCFVSMNTQGRPTAKKKDHEVQIRLKRTTWIQVHLTKTR